VIHPTAVVHPGARVSSDAEVGPYCVVGGDVRIGANTKLLAHVVVNGHTEIGSECTIFPFASVGMSSQDRKYRGERAETRIGDRTTLREYVSVHRATGEGEATTIGNDCLLLAYVHIAHNCVVGDHVTMSNNAQLAGHVIVEDHVVIGGMAGFHQFVRVGAYAMVGGMSRIDKDVPPFFLVEGNPPDVRNLNWVGLRRAGMASAELAELKESYRVLYHSNRNISQAREVLRETVHTPAGRRLLDFLEADTDRGILKPIRRTRMDDIDDGAAVDADEATEALR
jgi:UDP-N-acetylglucosamine acyltransferase